MKVLLDECLDARYRNHIPGHDVYTVTYMKWSGIKNGQLLALAAADDFDALITTDRNIQHQQNLTRLPLSVVVLLAKSNELSDLLPFTPNLLMALQSLQPRTLVRVAP